MRCDEVNECCSVVKWFGAVAAWCIQMEVQDHHGHSLADSELGGGAKQGLTLVRW